MDVGVVLAEKIGKEPMVVEVEFERIFGRWLSNGVAKPRAVYSRGEDPGSSARSTPALTKIVALFASTFKARICDAQIKRALAPGRESSGGAVTRPAR
jgi:hypothetical protein